jgi:hypothetical protein
MQAKNTSGRKRRAPGRCTGCYRWLPGGLLLQAPGGEVCLLTVVTDEVGHMTLELTPVSLKKAGRVLKGKGKRCKKRI